jgi:hypothetical protein
MQGGVNYFSDIPPKLVENDIINSIITKYDKENKEQGIDKIIKKIYVLIEDYFSYILFFSLLIIFLYYRYNIMQKRKLNQSNTF